MTNRTHNHRAFTLIELLVVIAIIGVLISILLPAITGARSQAKSAVCLSRLRTLGQGMQLYINLYKDTFPPGRMPKVNDDQVRMRILGGWKYRPSFLAMMANEVGMQPFTEPIANKKLIDEEGQPGDRQNYASEVYVCPETPHWLDERNGSYGYNYQFLGNTRLRDEQYLTSYKNWPVKSASVRTPSDCVAIGDSMGTAASYIPRERTPYEDNNFADSRSARTSSAYGNEGFNFDPPRVDPENGEMAGLEEGHRTALHPRHRDYGNILWVDAHASGESLESLGYEVTEDGIITFDGNNTRFHPQALDEPWLQDPNLRRPQPDRP